MSDNPKEIGIAHGQPPTSSLLSDAVQKQLIGTWKIIAFEDRKDEHDPNSEWTYPYGKNPKGYFVYDNTGHVMMQIMKTPPSPPFASGDDEKPTAEEMKTAFTGYGAYFGTYTVDAAKNVVIHHDALPAEVRSRLASDLPEWKALLTSRDAFPNIDRNAVKGLTVPTLLITGEKTLPEMRMITYELSRLLPDAKVVAIPGATHDMWIEAPEACRNATLKFIGAHDR
jgi:pimeloyl-ACP methyl ester carboxylesterase